LKWLIFSPIDNLAVATTIALTRQEDFETVRFDSLEQRYSQTPIPSTALLFASGLLGLTGFRKKFKK